MADRSGATGNLASIDEILSALAAKRRRYVLYYLQEEETASLDDLARELATWETDQSPTETSESAVERLKVQLYHEHLPELAASHLIEFDERSKYVRYKHPPTLLEKFLRWCAKFESPSSLSTDPNS